MRSPTIRQLDKIYETIYMIVALNTPDDIILHVDECQAEITGTQRLSYTQRLKLHKTYLKKLIKKTGFKQTIQAVEEKIEEVVEKINIVDEKIQTTNPEAFANARKNLKQTKKEPKQDLTIKLVDSFYPVESEELNQRYTKKLIK